MQSITYNEYELMRVYKNNIMNHLTNISSCDNTKDLNMKIMNEAIDNLIKTNDVNNFNDTYIIIENNFINQLDKISINNKQLITRQYKMFVDNINDMIQYLNYINKTKLHLIKIPIQIQFYLRSSSDNSYKNIFECQNNNPHIIKLYNESLESLESLEPQKTNISHINQNKLFTNTQEYNNECYIDNIYESFVNVFNHIKNIILCQ